MKIDSDVVAGKWSDTTRRVEVTCKLPNSISFIVIIIIVSLPVVPEIGFYWQQGAEEPSSIVSLLDDAGMQ